MNEAFSPVKPRILVAPLDWGLGHATRCIPVIRQLLNENCEVLLAGEGKIKALLMAEFPTLTCLPLKGYDIRYGRNKWELFAKIIFQVPKIIRAIKYENNWLKKAAEEHRLTAVISDNRYGLYHPRIPSIFICHQLVIKTPLGAKVDRWLQRWNYRYINRFTECWVPDEPEGKSLAGELSHPALKPAILTRYLGPLSRFGNSPHAPGKGLLIILSGPEPQRTLFENLLRKQLLFCKEPMLLVRGLPEEKKVPFEIHGVKIVNHLPAAELQQAMKEASLVISRCGYSTVMDLAVLQKKSILVPTPGQTEQEYLAGHLTKEGTALCLPQPTFSLPDALKLSYSFPYRFVPLKKDSRLFQAIASLLAKDSVL